MPPTLWRKALGAAMLILVGVLVGQGQALAHASLVRSDPPANAVLPDAPPWVRLWFSEAVEGRSSQIAVYDSGRKRVDKGNASVLPEDPLSLKVDLEPLGVGTYTVAWQVMSAVDGHITRGFFVFSVGEAAPTQAPAPSSEGAGAPAPTPLEVLVRWVSLLGSAILFAGFPLTLLHPRTSWKRAGGALAATLAPFGKELRGTMVVAVVAVACMAPASLMVQASSTGDASLAALSTLLWGTRFGVVWLARAALVVSLAALLYVWVKKSQGWEAWGGLALGATLLLTFSLNSHGAALTGQGWLPLFSDWLHLLAASVWIGGLVHLARGLLPRLRPLGKKKVDTAQASQLLLPFSNLSVISVSVLLLTGLYNAWLEVGPVDSLLGTYYGRALLLKLGLSLPAFLLGALHARRVSQLVVAGARWRGPLPTTRRVWWEVSLGILVFLAVALLVALPPGREASGQGRRGPMVLSQRAGDVNITLEIDPGAVGPNYFRASLRDGQGRPPDEGAGLIVRFNFLDGELGAEAALAQRVGPGLYEGRWSYLGVAGRWRIEAVLRREGLDDLSASFPVSVEVAQTVPSSVAGSAAAPGSGALLAGLEILLLGLILAGVTWLKRAALGAALERPFKGFLMGLGYDLGRPAQKEVVTTVLVAGALIAFLGLYLTLGETLDLDSSAGLPRNPIPPSAQSRALGKEIYVQHCLSCHGPEGLGDGPAVQKYQPGLDLTPHVLAHPSGQLFLWVTYGLGAAMPPFQDQLSEEERWHVVNYIRTFGRSSFFGFHAH